MYAGRPFNENNSFGHVYHVLRDAIVQGRVRPDRRLFPAELADQLGVSQTPVREALIKLHMEGFIVARPHRGFFAKPAYLHELNNLYMLAHALLACAIRRLSGPLQLVLPTLPSADCHLSPATDGVDSTDACDAATAVGLIEQLFESIVRSSGNDEMLRIFCNILGRTRLIRVIDMEDRDVRASTMNTMCSISQDLQDGRHEDALRLLDLQLERELNVLPCLVDQANGRMLNAPNAGFRLPRARQPSRKGSGRSRSVEAVAGRRLMVPVA
jgi:DNA-binding GntR family transcriptional regulator